MFKQYTINRWYNFACSIVIQSYLENHQRVRGEENKRSFTKDIFIDDKPFDFKITYPFKGMSEKMFLKNLDNPTELIIKYYKGGGKQRMHTEPKLLAEKLQYRQAVNSLNFIYSFQVNSWNE